MTYVIDEKTNKLYDANIGVREGLFDELKQTNPNKIITAKNDKGEEEQIPLFRLILYSIWRNTIGLLKK